jgi:hypothetical protein
MSEIVIYSVIGVIGIVSGFIGVIAGASLMLKRLKQEIPNIVLDSIEGFMPELPKLMATEEFRQFFGAIGALIGSGARGQLLGGKGGKLKFEDLLIQGVQSFIMPKVQQIVETQGSQEIATSTTKPW